MSEAVVRRVPRVRAYLLRESISWAAALLALAGLAGLAGALYLPIDRLRASEAWVMVRGADGDAVSLQLDVLPGWARMFSTADDVIGGVALCLGAWMLRRVLLSVGSGAPFDARNPRRLRWVALSVVLGTLLEPFSTYWATRAVLADAGADPATAYLRWEPWGPFGLGDIGLALLALAAAEAFAQGRRLADDADGLV